MILRSRRLVRIQHPNLVTLVGYHASEVEMFLIYNYFRQGNSESLIHGCVCGQMMGWRLHHQIAMDITQSLAYLQVDSLPQVLHQDMKASNILLNNNLNAHLSELGPAELLGDSETHAKQLMWLPLLGMWIQNMP